MIYVHIGCPKVASTTLQNFLAANTHFLSRHNLRYPRVQAANGRSRTKHNDTLYRELASGCPGEGWANLPKDNFILSAEGFYLNDPHLMRSALGYRQAKIIIYLREFAHLLPSLYAQVTRFGFNHDDFDTFLGSEYVSQACDVVGRLSGFADAFGAKNIAVRLLDKQHLVGGDIRSDFLSTIGITDTDFVLTADTNVSPDWKTLEIWRDIHKSLAEQLKPNELAQARLARNRKQPNPLFDFISAMEPVCNEIGRSLGWRDSGRYVTREQFEQWDHAFSTILDRLKAAGMNLSFDRRTPDDFKPREFLPSIERIPVDEVAEFMRSFSSSAVWHLLGGTISK